MPTKRSLPVLVPERLRRVPRSFAWINHRLRSGGFLEKLTPEEIALYLFLALAADRHGLSCWRLDRMEREIPFDAGALTRARNGLLAKDLVAFRPWRAKSVDGSYQVLSLPKVKAAARRTGGVASLGEVLSGTFEKQR
jgi:hypothetical protein